MHNLFLIFSFDIPTMLILFFKMSFVLRIYESKPVSPLPHLLRERQNQGKINRKMDKRVKELTLQVEDERRLADQYKDQVRAFY